MAPARVLRIGAYLFPIVALIVVAALALPPDLDETYYWAWSRELAWAYYDHPPAIAWAIRASTLFSDRILFLRLPSLVSMLIVAVATDASVKRLVPADRIARQLALLSLLGAPMFVLGYLPATPDPLQGAAVALAAYLIVREQLVGAAALLTAGLLIKHSTVFLLLPLLVLAPRSLIGAGWASVLLIPWLVSDASAAFQLDRVFSSTPRGPIAIPLTVGSMMATLGPLTALLLFALPLVRQPPPERILSLGSALLLCACVFAVWFGTGEANWPMPSMVFALPALVGFVVRRGGRLLAAALWIARASALLMVVALLHVVHPFLPIPAAKDRTLRSAGFEEVASAARSVAARIGATKVVARRYQIASELRYHLQDELTVHELGTSRRSQYDLWPRPPLCRGEAVVLVLPHDRIELPADAIAEPVQVQRARGDRVLDTYWVTPLRMREDVGACR
jgi:hypothetical protein